MRYLFSLIQCEFEQSRMNLKRWNFNFGCCQILKITKMCNLLKFYILVFANSAANLFKASSETLPEVITVLYLKVTD